MGEPVFGFELECLVPVQKNVGSIATPVGRWTRHWDVSIGGGGAGLFSWLSSFFSHSDNTVWSSAEYVSPIFRMKDIDALFAPMMKHLGGTDKDLNGIKINSSCGAHIHFSWKRDTGSINHLNFRIPKEQLKMVKKMAEGKVLKTLPHLASAFQGQYFRGYAAKWNDWKELDSHYHEFSFTTNKGTEWRSFNLQGVQNWGEIKSMVKLGCETITELLTEKMQGKGRVEIPLDAIASTEGFVKTDMAIEMLNG